MCLPACIGHFGQVRTFSDLRVSVRQPFRIIHAMSVSMIYLYTRVQQSYRIPRQAFSENADHNSLSGTSMIYRIYFAVDMTLMLARRTEPAQISKLVARVQLSSTCTTLLSAKPMVSAEYMWSAHANRCASLHHVEVARVQLSSTCTTLLSAEPMVSAEYMWSMQIDVHHSTTWRSAVPGLAYFVLLVSQRTSNA